jgi:hypothetical protein
MGGHVVTVQSVLILTAEGAEIAEIQITFRLAPLIRAEICLHFSARFRYGRLCRAFSAVKIDPQLNGYGHVLRILKLTSIFSADPATPPLNPPRRNRGEGCFPSPV